MGDRRSGSAADGPHLVGVTGPIASGKSLFVHHLEQAHALPVIDADAIGHEALEPGSVIVPALLRRFGQSVARDDGSIDRAVLGPIVFSDEGSLADLNALVQPWILAEIERRVAGLKAAGYLGIILLDAALLGDWGDRCSTRAVIFIRAAWEVRLSRLLAKGVAPPDAHRRMTVHARLFARPVPSDWFVVDNDGTPETLRDRADEVWPILQERLRKRESE